MRVETILAKAASGLLSGLCAACATTVADDSPVPSQLDRLRVLAIAAEPPDLGPGESTELRSLVFAPAAGQVEYAWSWCPWSIDLGLGAVCPIEEVTWRQIWTQAGLGGEPLPYDLGTGVSAAFAPGIAGANGQRLCESVAALGAQAQALRAACASGLEATVVLRVRAGGDEEVATKRISLLSEALPDARRNHNPGPLGTVSVRLEPASLLSLAPGTLLGGGEHVLRLDASEALSEVVPEVEMSPLVAGAGEKGSPGGGDAPRETLVLSWFSTLGKLEEPEDDAPGGGPFGGDSQRTAYVPGESDFGRFLENGWKLPPGAGQSAELVLVLRDGRGGVAWRREQFEVVGGQP